VNLDALVAPLRADVISGAAAVSRTAAEVVRRVAVRAEADDVPGLRKVIGELGVRLLEAQPAMAPLVSLVTLVLAALDDIEDLADARREAARAAESFRGSVDERTRRVGRRAARELPTEGAVMTFSSSSTVRAALLDGERRGALRVICLESRPVAEGQAVARTLAAAGMPVTFAVDAAAERLLPDCSALLLGADSIGDVGIVNKIGSAQIARSARAQGVPVWVLADHTKLLPPSFPQPLDDDRPSDEVWQAPSGVRVWNRYFERVPEELVHRVVTEDGSHSPDALHAARRALPVPLELAGGSGRRE
jgi:translation initiation factor 2B subunit (eIF-2B alpha/beta/delta family)